LHFILLPYSFFTKNNHPLEVLQIDYAENNFPNPPNLSLLKGGEFLPPFSKGGIMVLNILRG
jgi:hypothetical protein